MSGREHFAVREAAPNHIIRDILLPQVIGRTPLEAKELADATGFMVILEVWSPTRAYIPYRIRYWLDTTGLIYDAALG